MDLNLFATQIVQGSQKGSALIGSKNILGNNGIVNGNAVAFWDAILSNIAEGEMDTNTDNKNSSSQDTTTKLKSETVDLALLKIALLGQNADKNLEQKLKDLGIENIAQNQENRIAQLTKMIEHLTSGLPSAGLKGGSIEDLVTRLNKRLENLESSLNAFRTGDFGDDGAPFELLIASGLNPSQLTRIADRIEEVEQKLGRELTVEDLIAGVGNIIPVPGTDDENEFSSVDALSIIINNSETDKVSENSNKKFDSVTELDTANAHRRNKDIADINSDLAAIINMVSAIKITPTDTPKIGLKPVAANLEAISNLQSGVNPAIGGQNVNGVETDMTAIPSTVNSEEALLNFEQQLSNAEFRALFGGKGANLNVQNNNFAKLNAASMTQDATLPTLSSTGDIFLPRAWHDAAISHSALSDALGFDVQTGTPFTTTMQAAHAASASNHAGQNHPATQMVAAKITKAALNGETRGITLQLDPPELGRVEIRMIFGDDKTVKAHLVVEKPETLLMLQRDANALEKALQNAGLETDSGSLDYQMAAENYNFGQDGDRRGNNGQDSPANRADAANEELELIETTINWNVDPETGHVRYNILA